MSIISWWRRFWRTLFPDPGIRCIAKVESADEIPAELPKNGAVVVVSGSYQKWVAFDCPCSARHRIMLNLDRTRHPSWTVHQLTNGNLSIAPSVNYYDGDRRCHYFIRDGQINWVEDSFDGRAGKK